MKTVKLTDGQFKLLISLIKEAIENRSNCGCNDVYKNELKLFTAEEIKEAIVAFGGKKYLASLKDDVKKEGSNFDEEIKNGYGSFDTTFAQHLLTVIKKQK